MTKKISYALIGGAFGAITVNLAVWAFYGFNSYDDFTITLNRLMIWSCLWSLLLMIPKFDNQWFLKTISLACIVILFNFVVLMPFNGVGFFAFYAPLPVFLGNIIFNFVWCIVSGYWYHICLEEN